VHPAWHQPTNLHGISDGRSTVFPNVHGNSGGIATAGPVSDLTATAGPVSDLTAGWNGPRPLGEGYGQGPGFDVRTLLSYADAQNQAVLPPAETDAFGPHQRSGYILPDTETESCPPAWGHSIPMSQPSPSTSCQSSSSEATVFPDETRVAVGPIQCPQTISFAEFARIGVPDLADDANDDEDDRQLQAVYPAASTEQGSILRNSDKNLA
jgi:hypothetical protein